MTAVFGRILLVERQKALVVPVTVPATWAKQRISLSLCGADLVPLAGTLVKTAAFTGLSLIHIYAADESPVV